MKIKIIVTKEILYRSQNCNTENQRTNCAIALAIRELFPNALVWGCGISGLDADILPDQEDWGMNIGYQIRFSPDVTAWITEFDKLTPEERISLPEYQFDITVPPSSIEKIGIGEVYRVLSESKTLELINP